MKRSLLITVIAGGLLAFAGGGFAAGRYMLPPEIKTEVRTETKTVEVEVKGPVEYRTKKVVPASCLTAMRSGDQMADLLDQYDALVSSEVHKLYVDLVTSLNVVFDAGNAIIADVSSVKSTLERTQDRYFNIEDQQESLHDQWSKTPWYDPAEKCLAAGNS